MPRERLILPTNFPASMTASDVSSVRLVRKIYLLTDTTAFAVAGDEEPIVDALSVLSGLMPNFLKEERPLAPVARHVNEFGGKVQIIGIEVPGGNPASFHKVHPLNNGFELPVLGECAAVGSGLTNVRHVCEKYAKSENIARTMERGGPIEVIRGVASALNHKIMLDEIFGEQSRTYGAYFEHAFFNPFEHRWQYGPSSVHLFYGAFRSSESQFKIALIGRAMAYAPGPVVARLLTLRLANEGAHPLDIVLDNILSPSSAVVAPEFWKDWRPESVTVSFVADWRRIGGISTRTTNWGEEAHLIFEYGRSRVRIGLQQDYLDQLANDAGRAWAMIYGGPL